MNKFYTCVITAVAVTALNKILNVTFKKILEKQKKIHLRFIESAIKVIIYAMGVYMILSQFDTTQKFMKSVVTSSSIIEAVVKLLS